MYWREWVLLTQHYQCKQSTAWGQPYATITPFRCGSICCRRRSPGSSVALISIRCFVGFRGNKTEYLLASLPSDGKRALKDRLAAPPDYSDGAFHDAGGLENRIWHCQDRERYSGTGSPEFEPA